MMAANPVVLARLGRALNAKRTSPTSPGRNTRRSAATQQRAIDGWRYANQIPTRAWRSHRLIERGLSAPK
jgi:hypothetical protein